MGDDALEEQRRVLNDLGRELNGNGLATIAFVRLVEKPVAPLGFQDFVGHGHLEGMVGKQLLANRHAVVVAQGGAAIDADTNAYGNGHGKVKKYKQATQPTGRAQATLRKRTKEFRMLLAAPAFATDHQRLARAG